MKFLGISDTIKIDRQRRERGGRGRERLGFHVRNFVAKLSYIHR